MQDPLLQVATASEPLTLDEEYAMQSSWRTDADKLTFIVCNPPLPLPQHVTARQEDAPHDMIGDVNLFLTPDNGEVEEVGNEDESQALIGEIEIMIADKKQQGRGLGREILLVFMWYIMHSRDSVLEEYCAGNGNAKKRVHMKYLRVKIDKDNVRSVRLFQNAGFNKVNEEPNYFGELELRWYFTDSTEQVDKKFSTTPIQLEYRS